MDISNNESINNEINYTEDVDHANTQNIYMNTENDLSSIVYEQHMKIWMNKSYCKYNDIEIEKCNNEIQHYDNLGTALEELIKKEKQYKEFLMQHRNKLLLEWKALKPAQNIFEDLTIPQKELNQFKIKHYKTTLEQHKTKFYATQDHFQDCVPFYDDSLKSKAKNSKLLVIHKTCLQNISTTSQILKQHTEILGKLLNCEIVNFSKVVQDYQRNKVSQILIETLTKNLFDISHMYQSKCVESEKNGGQLKRSPEELNTPWSQLPDMKDVHLQSMSINKPIYNPSTININSKYPESLAKLQKQKIRSEEKRKNLEEAQKNEISKLKRIVSNNNLNTSLNKSIDMLQRMESDTLNGSKRINPQLKRDKAISKQKVLTSALSKNNNVEENVKNFAPQFAMPLATRKCNYKAYEGPLIVQNRNISRHNSKQGFGSSTRNVTILNQHIITPSTNELHHMKSNDAFIPGAQNTSFKDFGMPQFRKNSQKEVQFSGLDDNVFKKPRLAGQTYQDEGENETYALSPTKEIAEEPENLFPFSKKVQPHDSFSFKSNAFQSNYGQGTKDFSFRD